MVNVLEGNSYGSQLGRALTSGVEKGVDFAQKMGIKRRDAVRKNLSKVTSGIKSHLSLYDPDKNFDSSKIGELDARARHYIEKGLYPDEAIGRAFHEMTSGGDQAGEDQEGGKRSVFDQMGVTGDKGSSPWEGNPELLKKLGIVSDEGFFEDVKTGLKKGIRPLVQLADFPFSFAKRLGVTPRGKTLNDYDTFTDMYDKATGGKGKPQNIVERLTAGYPLGGAGVAAEGVQETLNTFGAPESVQEAGGILTLLLAHRVKIPEANTVVKRAEKVAKDTGKTTEAVLEKAQKESGIKLEDVAKGDESAIRSLKEKITEAPKISEKVKETPKTVFNKKGAEKERRVFGEKLSQSPLDEYYNIKAKEAETQANKRPETLAREKEIRATLAPEEKRLIDDLRHKREDLARMDKARKKLIGQEKARVDTLYQHRVKSIEESTDKLKDVQYQMKYGRARPSEAEINAQIESSVKRFKEGIENPTPENIKSLSRQLELDKKYIERAAQLEKRGELSGEIRPDTFLRMQNKYLEGYKAAIKEAKESINALKQADDPMALSSIAKEKKLIETLQDRIKRLEANIVNQTDNIKAMRALEKPSGAFYKQQLKNLKKDDALFRHDLFKQNKLNSPEDLKVSKTYKENSPEVKLGKETAENPTPENLKKASEQTGKSEEAIKEDLKKGGEEFQKAAEQVNKGTVTPNLVDKILKWFKKFTYAVGAGFASGAILGLADEVLGIKINSTLYRRLLSSAHFKNLGPITIGRDVIRNLFDDAQAKKLESLRSDFNAYNQYVAQMRKSYGESKVKRVKKKMKEHRSQK